MTSFINSVLQDLLKQHSKLSTFTFILPSKRAGAFLKREISRQITQPVFSPEVISIEEFSEKVSGITTLDSISTLFKFYSIYKNEDSKEGKEDFESFSTWAQTLIQDFNEIDRYLIPTNEIFNYLAEIQDINHWSLTPHKTTLVKNYLAFWKELPKYYTLLKTSLLKNNSGYQGLVYRQAAENIEKFAKNNTSSHIFIGFNALNTAEQIMIQKMLQHGAKVYWDVDQIHFKDNEHDASLFIRSYAQNWPYYKENNVNFISSTYNTPKNINIAGIPKSVGQAKYLGEILSRLDPEELSNTAVVLGDESLLLPVLNSLPENIPAINITMGYPLHLSPFTSLFEILFQIYKTGETNYYYKDVIAILNNPIIQKILGKSSFEVVNQIREQNLLYLDKNRVEKLFSKEIPVLITSLFPNEPHTPGSCLNTFIEIICHLKEQLSNGDNALNLEFLYHYHLVFGKLRILTNKYPHIQAISTLHQFFKEIINTQSLDFQGKPFHGLQLMGMLESRVLDFKNVILTSVDEGTLPAGKSNNSFIPYELKKAFKLPTYKEKDAVYTYHFYHLLQRAQNIHLLHNTDTESHMGGEKSRFLLQLELEKQPLHTVKTFVVTPEVPVVTTSLQQVEKTPAILQKIQQLATKGFSPSSLTTYMRNPLDFYKQYILNVRDKEEVEETVAYNTLGTVVHDTLEAFYSPLTGKQLTLDHITDFKSRISAEVKAQFEKSYSKVPLARGKNLLIFEVAKRYVANFLKMETKEINEGKNIIIKQIETNLEATLEPLLNNIPVKIRGKVDRVDLADGTLRIIDYKTGKVTQQQLEIINWDELTTDYDKYAKPFQVLMYATMLLESDPPTGSVIEAGVISFKNLKGGFLKFGKKESARDKNKNCRIEEDTIQNFKVELKNLVSEICDPKIPFIEKEIKTGYGNY